MLLVLTGGAAQLQKVFVLAQSHNLFGVVL
jgi:hypothetical protein